LPILPSFSPGVFFQDSAVELIIDPGGQLNGQTKQEAQVQTLSHFLPSGPSQRSSSKILLPAGMPKDKQSRKPNALAA
jgi:hypothetical protein